MTGDQVLELVLPRRLDSPNKSRGFHWSVRNRDRGHWQMLLHSAIRDAERYRRWNLIESREVKTGRTGKPYIQERRRQERRRVTVIRLVKSARRFIRDDDNLRFCVKPINDAVKRLGLVYDDQREWMEQPPVEQRVAPDGVEQTIVRIERLEELA